MSNAFRAPLGALVLASIVRIGLAEPQACLDATNVGLNISSSEDFFMLPISIKAPDWAPKLSRCPRVVAALVGLAAVMVLESVWTFQLTGNPPCELCLAERLPYYAAVPLSALVWQASSRGRTTSSRIGLAAIGLLFVASAALGGYHVGFEWGLWPGPSSCMDVDGLDFDPRDLMTLASKSIVACDKPSVLIRGISLAGWSAIVSSGLAAMALFVALATPKRERAECPPRS